MPAYARVRPWLIGDGAVGTFYRNIGDIGMRGGAAPARAYQPEPLEAVLAGRIDPGRVCDFTTDLDHVTDTEYLGSSN